MIDEQMFEDRVPVSLSQGHQREVVTLIHCWPPPRGSLHCKRPKLPVTGGNQLMIPLVKAHDISI